MSGHKKREFSFFVVLSPWLEAGCPPKLLYHSTGKGGKCNKKLVGSIKTRERSMTNYHHGQNGLDLWKLV